MSKKGVAVIICDIIIYAIIGYMYVEIIKDDECQRKNDGRGINQGN